MHTHTEKQIQRNTNEGGAIKASDFLRRKEKKTAIEEDVKFYSLFEIAA